MRMRGLHVAAAALAVLPLLFAPAAAQVARTWVAGLGDDANPCSLTAPCKTFAGAISKTAAGGEISVMNSAGYGAVTITKSISLVAAGAEGSILASGSAGLIIKADPADVVHIDGIMIEGAGIGTVGIRILSAAAVHIRNCAIRDFRAAPGLGIEIAPGSATRVFISGCVVANSTGAIEVKPTGQGSAQVFLDRVQLENNAAAGLRAEGRNAVVRLNQSTITNNGIGIEAAAGGSIISFGNNALIGNKTDGTPTATQPLK